MEAGRIFIEINNAVIPSKPGAKMQPGGLAATATVTDQQDVDFFDTFHPCVIDCVIPLDGTVDIEQLRAIRNLDGKFRTDNGIVFNITKLSAQDGHEWTYQGGGEGVPAKFFGKAKKA